jgi:hypothetical protein
LDFGAEGFTASLTDWHELLQITSPDPVCGMVYVRGLCPDNPASILARSQRRDDIGEKGTFGLQIQPPRLEKPQPSALERGDRIAHGLVNFRWPYSQYELKHKGQSKEIDAGDIGTCEEISWVNDSTVFQALRVKSASRNRIAYVDVRVGGKIRFGCPCCNRSTIQDEDDHKGDELTSILSADDFQLSTASCLYGKRLEMQLFIDGDCQAFERSSNPADYLSNCQKRRLELVPGQPKTIVATFRLVDDKNPVQAGDLARYIKAPFEKVESDLGIALDSIDMTDRLWTACLPPNYTAMQAREFCALARCVEQIMGVTSVPVSPEHGVALVYNTITTQYVDLQSTL